MEEKFARIFVGYSIDYLCVCFSLTSRAVQRSLAIIRQAKQKKEKKKEYCMYYNRFGKCNRGESCPYIHDPEKVAVCTRYPPFPSRQHPVDAGPALPFRKGDTSQQEFCLLNLVPAAASKVAQVMDETPWMDEE